MFCISEAFGLIAKPKIYTLEFRCIALQAAKLFTKLNLTNQPNGNNDTT